jgi:predicted TIM-barrel fold metal-dependent hydrolase
VPWWFNAPRRLAEVVGEAIQFAGEDRIVWGSDFFGAGGLIRMAVQGAKEMQIPEDLQRGYGYKSITDEVRKKIFGENLARLLKIDTSKRRVPAAH